VAGFGEVSVLVFGEVIETRTGATAVTLSVLSVPPSAGLATVELSVDSVLERFPLVASSVVVAAETWLPISLGSATGLLPLVLALSFRVAVGVDGFELGAAGTAWCGLGLLAGG